MPPTCNLPTTFPPCGITRMVSDLNKTAGKPANQSGPIQTAVCAAPYGAVNAQTLGARAATAGGKGRLPAARVATQLAKKRESSHNCAGLAAFIRNMKAISKEEGEFPMPTTHRDGRDNMRWYGIATPPAPSGEAANAYQTGSSSGIGVTASDVQWETQTFGNTCLRAVPLPGHGSLNNGASRHLIAHGI